MIKILMADDHPVLRTGLKKLFFWAGDIEVVSEAINGSQVLEQLKSNVYDVLLLDISMPAPNGVELINIIKAIQNNTPILVLSMHIDIQIVKNALLAGAAGFLTKDSEPESILLAIREVAQGRTFIAPIFADLI